MTSRLATEAPELDRILTGAPARIARKAGVATVSVLALQFPEVLHELTAALGDRNIESAAALAVRLDDHCLDMQDQDEEGFERVFACARIAMATKFAIEGSVNEALYEGIVATGDVARVTTLFLEALSGED